MRSIAKFLKGGQEGGALCFFDKDKQGLTDDEMAGKVEEQGRGIVGASDDPVDIGFDIASYAEVDFSFRVACAGNNLLSYRLLRHGLLRG